MRRSTANCLGVLPFTNRVGLMFVTRLGGYDGVAFPCGKAAVPIVTPHPPDVLAVGAVLIHSRSSPNLQMPTRLFRDQIPPKRSACSDASNIVGASSDRGIPERPGAIDAGRPNCRQRRGSDRHRRQRCGRNISTNFVPAAASPPAMDTARRANRLDRVFYGGAWPHRASAPAVGVAAGQLKRHALEHPFSGRSSG